MPDFIINPKKLLTITISGLEKIPHLPYLVSVGREWLKPNLLSIMNPAGSM